MGRWFDGTMHKRLVQIQNERERGCGGCLGRQVLRGAGTQVRDASVGRERLDELPRIEFIIIALVIVILQAVELGQSVFAWRAARFG